MKKISLKGPKQGLKKMIDALKGTGAFEQSNFRRASKDFAETSSSQHEHLTTLLSRTKTAIEFAKKSRLTYLSAIKNHKAFSSKIESHETIVAGYETKGAKDLFAVTDEIEYNDLKNIAGQEADVLNLLDTLEQSAARIYEIKTLINKNNALISELAPYINLNVSANLLHDTEEAFVLAGIISKDMLAKFKTDFDLSSIIIEEFVSDPKNACIVCIGHNNDYPLLNSIYDYGFERCKFNYGVTAKEKMNEFKEQNTLLYYENLDLLYKSCLTEEEAKLLKYYYDYLNNELDTEEVLKGTLQTEKDYVLNGWIVGKEEKKIIELIKSVGEDVAVKTEAASDKDTPPTLVKNNRIIAPYESITNLYSPPSKRDLDPNLFVALFYFIFFGVMIGDVGYGLLTFAVAAAILLFFKPKKGAKDLVLIICMGGISAVLWGFFFGSFFGLSKIGADGTATSLIPAVIDPINDSLLFLVFSLILGVVQIIAGLLLKFYNLLRHKKIIDAICDAGFRITLFVGLILFALGTFLDAVKVLTSPGLYIALASLGLILLTAGRKKKGVVGKVTGGLGGIYSLVNYFSDVLSYARLFGLGLVGAVIAMVANLMGEMLFAIPIVGIPLGILIALVFHVFNLAIGLLSAYVHNARLQFVEFFGKFYEGGGKEFSPLGSNMKYVKIKSNLNKKEGI